MVANFLQSKTIQALTNDLKDARAHLKELEFKLSASQLKNVREVRKTKKAIAQMLTALKQKQTQPLTKSE